jgi:signal transduction histidine kinase
LVRAVESTVLLGIRHTNAVELDSLRAQIERGVPPDEVEFPHGFARVHPPGVASVYSGPPGMPARAPPVPVFVLRGGPAHSSLPLPPPPPFAPGVPIGVGSEHAWSTLAGSAAPPHAGPLTIAVGRPLLEVQRSVETLTRILFVAVPILVAAMTLAAWVLIGRSLRPVHAMSRSAARIADATTADRLSVPATNDEVAELAATLNGMLDRLGESARRQREFVSDASHELRSPIATLRTLLEVEQAHPGHAEPATVRAALLDETSRLENLTADLLSLARLDEALAPRHAEVDLDDVVLEEVRRVRRVPVETLDVAPAKLEGDRKSLLHLVRNLLDNAARYAASRVRVTTRVEHDAVVLRVDDDGPGIPEADRVRIFDRFTRSGGDRSRDRGGTGLGLAVVRRIAEQHGGSVIATSSPWGGARLEVRFPA